MTVKTYHLAALCARCPFNVLQHRADPAQPAQGLGHRRDVHQHMRSQRPKVALLAGQDERQAAVDLFDDIDLLDVLQDRVYFAGCLACRLGCACRVCSLLDVRQPSRAEEGLPAATDGERAGNNATTGGSLAGGVLGDLVVIGRNGDFVTLHSDGDAGVVILVVESSSSSGWLLFLCFIDPLQLLIDPAFDFLGAQLVLDVTKDKVAHLFCSH